MISKLDTSDRPSFEKEDGVLVYLGDSEGTRQPDTFQFCPLGVHLYTETAVPECQLVEFTLSLPGPEAGSEQVQCIGIVAQCCEPADGERLFRVWVKFLDLRPDVAERIRQLTTDHRFICPFCETFTIPR